MSGTRLNPVTSAISGQGKGWGASVQSPGISPVGSLGDAVAAGTTPGVEVGNYRYITLYLGNTAAGGTVTPEVSGGKDPLSETNALATFVNLSNVKESAGAVAVANLVYTYSDDVTITIPVDGVKIVRFVLTGGPADIRYTLHA